MYNQKILDYLAENNIITSICFGPSGPTRKVYFSVDCMFANNSDGFENPFAANTMAQAVEIAYLECINAGWIEKNENVLLSLGVD